MSGDILPVQATDQPATPMRALFLGIQQAAGFAQSLRDQHPEWPCSQGRPHYNVVINLNIRTRTAEDGVPTSDWETEPYRIAACFNCHEPEMGSVEILLATLDQKTEYDREVWAEYKRWKESR